MGPEEPATKDDLRKVETDLRGEIKTVETNLRGEIRTVETALRGDIKKVETDLRGDIKNLERLIIDYMESMERELKDVRASLARLETRFDTQALRLDRQGALLQTGSRWSTRMNGWAERVDRALETKDREVSELRTRIEKLERPAGPPTA